jgi:hypothetical protein
MQCDLRPQPNEDTVFVHLAHEVGEVTEQSDAGEGRSA